MGALCLSQPSKIRLVHIPALMMSSGRRGWADWAASWDFLPAQLGKLSSILSRIKEIT